MLNAYDSQTGSSPVDYVFEILENLSGNITRRSYVVDLNNQVVYFRTGSHTPVRSFSLKSFDFSCDAPAQILDLNARFSGDVTGKFQDYTLRANRRIAESWVNHVVEMVPDGTKEDRENAGITAEHIDRYSRYSSFTLAESDLETGKNEYRLTALYWAAYQGDLQQVKNLLENGADANATTVIDTTPLLAAAQTGHLDVIQYLIDAGATIDHADVKGNTPLITALIFGRSDVAEYLIQRGANVKMPNKAGCGPLHYAAVNGNLGLVKILLANGADIQAQSDWGWTALTAAAFSGKLEMVQCLISQGTDQDAADKYGNTALLVAIMLKHSDIAEELIKAGADVRVQNNEGKTPWSIASEAKNKKMMKLLKEAGAKPPLKLWFF
jgi:ankyrin repeat protein